MDPRAAQLHRDAAAQRGVIGLAGALPAPELMPRAALARALGDVVTSRDDALQYGWPEGVEQLRVWIARRLAARGAAVDYERVIVTAGAQQALAIAAAAMHGAGVESIAVGDATYPGALDAFAQAGLRAVAHVGDAHYVIPAVSNPHGIARDADAPAGTTPILADEAYVELRFDGRVPIPLLAQAPARVWHVGTISKTLAPGLRLGWLLPPAGCQAAAIALKQAADLQTSSLSQAALARLLELVDYDEHVAATRRCYAARADAFADALLRYVPGVHFRMPEGGLSIWIEADDRGDELAFLRAALAAGVMIDPGSAFCPEPRERLAFRASFASAAPAQLADGARRLARALATWRAQR